MLPDDSQLMVSKTNVGLYDGRVGLVDYEITKLFIKNHRGIIS